eukprot:m.339684 g.339684  ORF g.339684 m.339684 type:complete len:734 (+) comp18911_c0_seq1:188-2389(+)
MTDLDWTSSASPREHLWDETLPLSTCYICRSKGKKGGAPPRKCGICGVSCHSGCVNSYRRKSTGTVGSSTANADVGLPLCQPTFTKPSAQIEKEAASVSVEPWSTLVLQPSDIVVDVPGQFAFRPPPNVTPLVVLINPKSGSKQGAKLLQELRRLLNPRQVFSLLEMGADNKVVGPRKALEIYRDCPRVRVLVCGGDGTVGWVLDVMDSLNLTDRQIPVGFLPLGTGNDLARSLKLGGGYDGTPMTKYLGKLLPGAVAPVKLDRWSVTTTLGEGCADSELGATVAQKLPQNVFNNYFSVGADALITLRFHNAREDNPHKYKSRVWNKMKYGMVGVKEVLTRPLKHLTQELELICDGTNYTDFVRSKKVEAIAFLNINSYMAGCRVWGTKDPVFDRQQFEAPSFNDNKIEVVGMTGFNIAFAQSHVGHALRICQCKEATIRTQKALPFQLDGEPCMLAGPAEVQVKLKNQATVLCKAKGRFKELRKANYEFDDTFSLTNVYMVVTKNDDMAVSFSLLKSLMLPTDATLGEIRKSHIDKEVLSEFKQGKGGGSVSWSYLSFGPAPETNSNAYRIISEEQEGMFTVSQFLAENDNTKPGLFITVRQIHASNTSRVVQSAAKGNTAVVQRHYERGLGTEVDEAGRTPLHAAASNGNIAIVVMLLFNHDENPNATDAKGRTPLHAAAEAGYAEICQQLVEAGAKNLRDKQDLTPLDLAKRHNHMKACEILEEYDVSNA